MKRVTELPMGQIMNRYPLEIFWSTEDQGFIAEVPDLPGCSAWGKSEADAVREAQDAIASWLEAARAVGRAVPAPSEKEPVQSFSGKFVLRPGRTLHARLARLAQFEGISLNQLATALLARAEARLSSLEDAVHEAQARRVQRATKETAIPAAHRPAHKLTVAHTPTKRKTSLIPAAKKMTSK